MKKLIAIFFSLFMVDPSFAAINAAMNWYVRVGGNEINGGGYDSTVAGAGTNYADQDAYQLALTDLTSTASTTATSAIGGFTAAMVGNVLRLASGTGSPTAGYYVITGYTDTNTITLDRASGTYTLGVAKVGGAFAGTVNFLTGGSATQPVLTAPEVAGNTIWIRGAGTDNPSSADYTETGYRNVTAGDATNGSIRLIGYNGRPYLAVDGLWMYSCPYWQFENLKIVAANTTNTGNGGMILGGTGSKIVNVYVDQNGFNVQGINANVIINCWLRNGGSSSAGTAQYAAIIPNGIYHGFVYGNYIESWKNDGIYSTNMTSIFNNVVRNCKGNGIEVTSLADYTGIIANNTIDGNTLDGILLGNAQNVYQNRIRNNIISNNGGWGLNLTAGSTAIGDRLTLTINDYNDYYNNTSGTINNGSLGAHDLTLDPQFTNRADGNYSIGTNLKAAGWPGTINSTSTLVGYMDMGAVQRQEAGSGGTKGYIFGN